MIRLIATDLDGTLLRSDLGVSPRTRAALDAARAAGIHVVPVTARQPRGVRRIAQAAGFTEDALCGNGAHGVHLGTGETLFEAHVTVAAQRVLAQALVARVPGVLFVSVREGGEIFVAQEGYAALARFEDHKREPAEMGLHALDDVLAAPSLKFIVRHAALTPRELLAEEVSKAWGLARLCERLGVTREEVLTFGDAPNDAEMLAWAGRGVAVANAHPEALEAADGVTLSKDEDGVALVIERLMDQSSPG